MHPASLTLIFSGLGHFIMHVTVGLYLTAVLFIEPAWGITYDVLINQWWWGALLVGGGAPICGWLGDRIGRARMMVIFFMLTGVSLGVITVAQTLVQIKVGLICLGLAAAIYHPVGIPWVASQDAPHRGRALGINGVFGAMGVALSPMIATGIESLANWRAMFLVFALISLIAGVALAVFARRLDAPIVQQKQARRPATPMMGYLLLGFFLIVALNATVWHSLNIAMPKWFALNLPQQSFLQVGLMVTFVYILASAGQIISGSLSDRLNPLGVYLMTLLLHIPFILLAGYVAGVPLIIVLALQTFFLTASLPVESLLILRITPQAWQGTVYGIKYIGAFGVQPLALMVVGYSYQRTTTLPFAPDLPFTSMVPILTLIALAALVIGMVIFRTHRPALHAAS
ncbi:MAG: MFS transporter [Pseudomonadota bacterium]